MIRILHMIGSLNIGGSQTMIMNIYRRMDRDKIQFDFIIDHHTHNCFTEEIKHLGGKVYTLPEFVGTNSSEVRCSWNEFLDAHKEYKILHSHVRSYASLYLPIAKSKGIKTIIHSHNTSNGSGIKSVIKTILQYPLRYQADYFMACSKDAGRWLFGEKTINSEKFTLIPNAIDGTIFSFNKNNREEIRQQFGIDDGNLVIGYLGRVVEQKNPGFAIEVFRELCKINENVVLLFVGDGDLLEKIKSESNDLSGKIIFTGARKDVDKLMSAMDCYIFPSLWEGFGMSLIEAQTNGLRCICSDKIPRDAIYTNLVNVLELKCCAKEWANKVNEIITNLDERCDMSKELIDAGFDINSQINLLEKIYINIINNS